ncbi:MAG TPA: tRNA uridine-5-carboxymethylaminomethyl(34) synthesis GTPase MnmE [Alphaproteobacteria bacterium]|nr:tRNA uridine-5-carboxymethylaminomethyl(34) synthesis GTPase MnmE [Alphaproteobacteria bacterium]
MKTDDTIFALSSAPGRAAIAVIRISGPAAGMALAKLSGRVALPEPRRGAFARLRNPENGAPLDDALVLWFPSPGSETGEDVAELQIHGGRATTAGVLTALAKLPGLRLAEPGEFTRRGFLNGKLDLTAVEGLADLVDAETEAQRCQALRQLRGGLSRLYEGWRARLIRLLAHAEARIDFPDEVDERGISEDQVSEVLGLSEEISQHLDDNRRGERLRDGLAVAILGAPNAGKSSLLNALARRDAAIVSELAGTTRDVIEVHLDLGGYPVILADTAGIRESGDLVEKEGVRRALARAEQADLRLVLVEAGKWPEIPTQLAPLLDDGSIPVTTKLDLARPAGELILNGRPALGISVRTGEGIPSLLRRLEEEAAKRLAAGEAPIVTRLRHREGLLDCLAALERAAKAAAPELAAEDLRMALRSLGRITGRVDVEELLDVIFRDFCIGK